MAGRFLNEGRPLPSSDTLPLTLTLSPLREVLAGRGNPASIGGDDDATIHVMAPSLRPSR